jgi:hypothetical protein
MGLDVYLYHLPDLDIDKVVLHYERSIQIDIQAQKGKNSPLTEEECAAICQQCLQLALDMGLPPDIENQINKKRQEVDLPSVKYPDEYRIGYWHSGYGGGGIDTILKLTIGSGLYDAFPEAKPRIYIKPNWQRSLQVLQDMLDRFQSKGFQNQNFLEVIGFSIDSAHDFLESFSSLTSKGQQLMDEFEDYFSPQSMFADYVKELEAIIETVEYVLAQPFKEEYILYWSA